MLLCMVWDSMAGKMHGNIGDRAVFLRDENVGGVERPRTEGSLAARYGCTVKQVYPLLPGEASGKP